MKNTYQFDFQTGEFVFKNGKIVIISKEDALEMWVEKALRTQYNRYKLYNGTYYGSNIEDLVMGKSYNHSFREIELRREIESCLLKHEDILSINTINIVYTEGTLGVNIVMNTIYGSKEVNKVYGNYSA